jgi:hypothetical protein
MPPGTRVRDWVHAYLIWAALAASACSATVHERRVAYVPVVVSACPCPAPARAPGATSRESYAGRDAVPRTARRPEKHHVKWGRAIGKRNHHPPGLEVAQAKAPPSPPGLAKHKADKKKRAR